MILRSPTSREISALIEASGRPKNSRKGEDRIRHPGNADLETAIDTPVDALRCQLRLSDNAFHSGIKRLCLTSSSCACSSFS
jgi:hypothetical protein